MHELTAVLAGVAELALRGQPAVLATVVEVQGSVYRRPGAHLLIGEGAPVAGSVSGGCLERDVAERAQEVLEGGAACVLTYDTSAGEDIVWGLGLGCNGVVSILLEPCSAQLPLLSYWEECLRLRQSGVVATVFRSNGEPSIGTRAYFAAGQELVPADFPDVAADARAVLQTNRSAVRYYGQTAVLLEAVIPPTHLVVCGAGADAIPLVRMAGELGWRVTVVDKRPAYANSRMFPRAERVVLATPAQAAAQLDLSTRDVGVVMSHHAQDDCEYLRALLSTPVAYIGMLGPRHRTDGFLDKLRAQGESFDLQRIFAPIGLDIGAETAEEIALSILAEIRSVQSGRPSGFLRQRQGPIHPEMHSELGAKNSPALARI